MLRNPILLTGNQVPETSEDVGHLVSRARKGDSAAFAQLYRRYINRVYVFAARRLASQEEAEEATQEIFTRALDGLGRCHNDEAFSGWLFGIANNVVSEQYRAAKYATSSIEDMPDPVDPDLNPEEHLIHGEDADELRRARERCLSEKERTLFDLLLADLTDKQIAMVLGRRRGSIRTARWRLMIKLRGCLNMLTRLTEVRHATT